MHRLQVKTPCNGDAAKSPTSAGNTNNGGKPFIIHYSLFTILHLFIQHLKFSIQNKF